MIPSFRGSGVPECGPESDTGTTASTGGCAIASASASPACSHSAKQASGNSSSAWATFSGLPARKRTGTARSAFDWRTERATSRPWEGRRERSMTKAAGGRALSSRIPIEVPGTVASTSYPSRSSRAARSGASSSLQWTRRM